MGAGRGGYLRGDGGEGDGRDVGEADVLQQLVGEQEEPQLGDAAAPHLCCCYTAPESHCHCFTSDHTDCPLLPPAFAMSLQPRGLYKYHV